MPPGGARPSQCQQASEHYEPHKSEVQHDDGIGQQPPRAAFIHIDPLCAHRNTWQQRALDLPLSSRMTPVASLLAGVGVIAAGAAARDLLDIELTLVPFAPFGERVRRTVTSYDAWYVAVAEELDLPLATLDRALAAARGPRCRFLLPPPR
jgi:hypothetical protein